MIVSLPTIMIRRKQFTIINSFVDNVEVRLFCYFIQFSVPSFKSTSQVVVIVIIITAREETQTYHCCHHQGQQTPNTFSFNIHTGLIFDC